MNPWGSQRKQRRNSPFQKDWDKKNIKRGIIDSSAELYFICGTIPSRGEKNSLTQGDYV
jgi:hypothetical protein